MKNPLVRLAPAIALGGSLMVTASGAFAFHPGETHSGDVPQGPECIACQNQGRQGIDVAILAGGMVHCDDVDDDGGDDDDGGGVE